jgi:hypothetical protein
MKATELLLNELLGRDDEDLTNRIGGLDEAPSADDDDDSDDEAATADNDVEKSRKAIE